MTVLTDLEVEIQQCRLRHVMEAPTLGPLYAHCNRQKKTDVSLHPACLPITARKSRNAIHAEEFYLAVKIARFPSIHYERTLADKAAAFVARPAEIINRVFSGARNYLT